MAISSTKQRSWRSILFRSVAGLVTLLLLAAGTLHGLVAVWVRSWVASEPGIHHPEIHLWHDAQIGALMGILLLGSLVNLIWQPAEKPLLAQFFGLGSLIYLLLLAPFDPGAAIFLGVILSLPLLCYPNLRSLFSFSGSGPFSKWLLGLTLVAAACLASDGWQWFRFQTLDSSEHAIANHWVTGAALVAILILAGLLAATKRAGWQTLGVITGIAFLHLGAATLTLPNQPGGWGVLGGLLAVVGGVAFIGLALLEAHLRPVASLPLQSQTTSS